jgi:hypothetical protein
VEQFETLLVKLRPLDSSGIEGKMCVDEESTEKLFVFPRSHHQGSRPALLKSDRARAIGGPSLCLQAEIHRRSPTLNVPTLFKNIRRRDFDGRFQQ